MVRVKLTAPVCTLCTKPGRRMVDGHPSCDAHATAVKAVARKRKVPLADATTLDVLVEAGRLMHTPAAVPATWDLTDVQHKMLLHIASMKDAFTLEAMRDAGIPETVVQQLRADPKREADVQTSARLSVTRRGRQLTTAYVWSPDITGFLLDDRTVVPMAAGVAAEATNMAKAKRVVKKGAKKSNAAGGWHRVYKHLKAPDPAPGDGSNMDKVYQAVKAMKRGTIDEIVSKASIKTDQDKRQQVMVFLQKLSHRGAVEIEKLDTPADSTPAPKAKVKAKGKVPARKKVVLKKAPAAAASATA